MTDNDSATGLMVWQDVMPEKKKDEVVSPRYTEEPGASSEYGIEVYDDAQRLEAETAIILKSVGTEIVRNNCGSIEV